MKKTGQYDTNSIEKIISTIISNNQEAVIIIKSTVNIGYTESLQKKFDTKKIIFSPEFLREGHALEDNLNPSRIIIGGLDGDARLFGEMLSKSIHIDEVPLIFMKSTAAESVKLFSNTYLAMRVAFFNELDGFCLKNNINTGHVIEGVSLDQRIGNFYNNPSFGFGGYCLPKDSKQLLSTFGNVPNDLIQAIQDSNASRTKFLSNEIMSLSPDTIGVYKLAMKKGLDNSRGSSIFDIIDRLIKKTKKILVYDPSSDTIPYKNISLVKDFDDFVQKSDLIITNRLDDQIRPFASKVFTRDLFSSDE
jgi:UDPglucose 6-dehydrogenase